MVGEEDEMKWYPGRKQGPRLRVRRKKRQKEMEGCQEVVLVP